jgi:signal transduction histidine kinase
MRLPVLNIVKTIDKKMWSYVDSWADYRRNYICIRLFFTLFLAMTIQSVVLYFNETKISALFSLVLALLYLSAILFFYLGKIAQTKNAVFFISNLLLFMGASMYGREGNSYVSFIPMLVAVVFIYSNKELTSMVVTILITTLNLSVLELTDYSLLSFMADGKMDSEYNRWMVIFIAVVFGFYMLYELIKMNKHTEEKLRRLNNNLQLRNEKLKRSNTELDSFVYRVSHDLRSPLTSIMGVISIVKTEKDPSKVKAYMKYQEQSVKKLDDLIQDVLDISRNAKLNVVIEPILLKEFIKSCVESFSYLDDFHKIKITIDFSDTLVLYSDSRRLKFIFNNLISNAIRYYDASKEQSALLICSDSHVEDEISILFDDNGIGIKEEHLEKVFDMFYRGTDVKSGSGLGLFIVRDSIEKLNGTISLHSIYGKGTRIHMTIPNAKKTFHNKMVITNFNVV